MSDQKRQPAPVLSELEELLGGESDSSRKFLRALAIGTLVGAAIAGSSIWQRRRGMGGRTPWTKSNAQG